MRNDRSDRPTFPGESLDANSLFAFITWTRIFVFGLCTSDGSQHHDVPSVDSDQYDRDGDAVDNSVLIGLSRFSR